MYGAQIDRLKRDSREVKHHMKRLEKEGNLNLAFKLRQKYEFLENKINDIEEEIFQKH